MNQEQTISQLLNVEEFQKQITKYRTTKARFRLPWSYNDSCTAIFLAYRQEVESRHITFRNDEATQQHIRQVVSFLTAPVPRYGILFCGNPGNGKTTLCQALRFTIKSIYCKKDSYNDERFLKFVHARDICDLAKNNNSKYQDLCREEMLAIDDLGTEPAEVLSYGNIVIPTIELLSRRYEEQLFTLITTNLTPKQIRTQYGSRIADRFNEMMGIIVFSNPSYRKPNATSQSNQTPAAKES